jgi:hypothetical protein
LSIVGLSKEVVMDVVEVAILRTVLYADVFNFPLTTSEIHHFLLHDEPVERTRIEYSLKTSPRLKQLLHQEQGYVVLTEHRHLIALRIAREQASAQLWRPALRYGQWLARVPFVRMVALTGALAMRNAVEGDDLDYLLVTRRGRVWLARAFAIVLVRLARLQGAEICPNYVLAEDALAQKRQDVFIAHEITQMVPLYGHDLYQAMRATNAWVSEHLPNAEGAYYQENGAAVSRGWSFLKRAVEFLLGGRAGDALEQWEYRRKLRRFAPRMQQPDSAAEIDSSHVKGHFEDHGSRTLHKYYERLRALGLDEDAVVQLQAGD